MGKQFKEEISLIPSTIEWANKQDVTHLSRSISNVSSRNLFAVGSGGSFTIATIVASLHEKYFGRLSRPITPLEYCLSGNNSTQTAVMLLSAEGKNNDILAAAKCALEWEHPCSALVLKTENPLSELSLLSGGICASSFEMPWDKDGYLATNSLIAMIILMVRAYENSVRRENEISFGSLDNKALNERRKLISNSVEHYKPGQQVLVLFSKSSQVAAIDIESKFAESSFGTCQLADYRQFAHGRHIQLDKFENSLVIAFVHSDDKELAEATLSLIPKDTARLVLPLPDAFGEASLQGVIDSILITEVIAGLIGVDPGQPEVPLFCREIYKLNLSQLISNEVGDIHPHINRKIRRSNHDFGLTSIYEESAKIFINKVINAKIKALVCDFDGTFCETVKRFDGLDCILINEIERLARSNIPIVFATGRGDSLFSDLRTKIKRKYWKFIYIGYYSGSYIDSLSRKPRFPPNDERFKKLLDWLDDMGIGFRIGATPKINCGQMSLRCSNQSIHYELVTAIKSWIRENGFMNWRVYCSGHSVDVLSDHAGKQKVVDYMVEQFSVNRYTEILRIGDSGDFDGNDYELLREGLSLSVNAVSSDPSSCWNFLPINKQGVIGTQFYLSHLELNSEDNTMSMRTINTQL